MKIVVSSQGDTLDAPTSTVFGRCPTFLLVDSESLLFEVLPNPAMNQGGGAGIQAAQFVANQGAEVVLTGNLGPNAFDVLEAANVASYLVPEGTIRQAVEAYKAGQLEPMSGANVAAHAGMRGGGRGMGQKGSPTPSPKPEPSAIRESELADLRDTLKSLRQQLAETLEKIERLEKEN